MKKSLQIYCKYKSFSSKLQAISQLAVTFHFKGYSLKLNKIFMLSGMRHENFVLLISASRFEICL